MEIEPIYCAEQIVVPAGLDQVLKEFTKEAIRHRPPDLVQFAAEYFGRQAALSRSLRDVQAPTQRQLRGAFLLLRGAAAAAPGGGGGGSGVVPLADVEAACRAEGINAATLARALRAGNVNTAGGVAAREALLVLLTLRCAGPGDVVRALFDVFGDGDDEGGGRSGGGSGSVGGPAQLGVPALLELLGHLAARDPAVTPALRDGAARALEGFMRATLAQLSAIPALAPLLQAGAPQPPPS